MTTKIWDKLRKRPKMNTLGCDCDNLEYAGKDIVEGDSGKFYFRCQRHGYFHCIDPSIVVEGFMQ